MEEFCKEFSRGRGSVKRTRDGMPNKPTAPRIYGRHKKHHYVPLEVSLESVPLGALMDWWSTYLNATPPVQRELLCMTKAIRSLKLRRVEDCL